jgi:hypothetical protein
MKLILSTFFRTPHIWGAVKSISKTPVSETIKRVSKGKSFRSFLNEIVS